MEMKAKSLSIAQWLELASDGASIPMTVPLDGVSMQPLIRRNRDLVTIVPLVREPLPGDVVLFEQLPGRFVCHRIFRVDGTQVQTFGDGCWSPDAWMDRSKVLGLAVSVERGVCRIALDTDYSRALGRAWMAIHPARITWRRFRSMVGHAFRKLGLGR